ncbi:MAG TPA: SDR family NAD(P)-dependent oxidoreductase [Mycobacterium sp.]
MTASPDLTGRRVLVTGASSGIGEATVRALIARGAKVAMLARRAERLDALRSQLGDRVYGIPCDVTDLDSLHAGVDAGAHALGGLDTVITVAGRGMVGTIATGDPAGWRELLDVNLIGPLATVRYAVPHFCADGRRDVVLIGSTGAITPTACVGVYGASKRGLRAAFDSLRLDGDAVSRDCLDKCFIVVSVGRRRQRKCHDHCDGQRHEAAAYGLHLVGQSAIPRM